MFDLQAVEKDLRHSQILKQLVELTLQTLNNKFKSCG